MYARLLMGFSFGEWINMQVRELSTQSRKPGLSRQNGLSPEKRPIRDSHVRNALVAGFSRIVEVMTMPLQPGRPGKSEFNFGEGHFPHPESDYQSQRSEIVAPVEEDIISNYRRFVADRRTDPTDATSGGYDDMLFELGNPDQFGPGPKLVREGVQRPSGEVPQPQFRTGVTREE